MMNPVPDKIHWGIIGCGDVCEVKSGPAFNKIPNSRLVAVMRRDAEKVKDFAIRHSVPKYYTDAGELIQDSAVNAIYIATPPSTHELYTEMALSAGKPVYVEKPVTIHSESLRRMMEAQKKYNGKVSVAHYRRSLPLFIKIKALLQSGELGKPGLVLLQTLQPPVSKMVAQTGGNWRINPALSGGGLFHDLSPHQLDILYWLFGPPLASDVQVINQGKLYPAPDLTMIQLRFENDLYFNGTWSFNVASEAAADRCEIIGDRGMLRFSFFSAGAIELINEKGNRIIEVEYPENIQLPHIRNVVQFFRGEGLNPCSLEEALITMEIMDKARL